MVPQCVNPSTAPLPEVPPELGAVIHPEVHPPWFGGNRTKSSSAPTGGKTSTPAAGVLPPFLPWKSNNVYSVQGTDPWQELPMPHSSNTVPHPAAGHVPPITPAWLAVP